MIDNLYNSNAYEISKQEEIIKTIIKPKSFKDKRLKKEELDKYILNRIVNQDMKETINDIYR